MIELYIQLGREIRAGHLASANETAKKLLNRLRDSYEIKGWNQIPRTGDEVLDVTLGRLDGYLIGPRAW